MSFSKALIRTVEIFTVYLHSYNKRHGTYDSQILYERSICNNNELKVGTKLTPVNNVLLSSDSFTFY